MDTELLLLCEDELPNIDFEELESNDLLDIEQYVEITRFLQEIHSIFEMFRYNSKRFWRKYASITQAKQRKIIRNNIYDDYISINALISNLLNSGKNLNEAMECYVKEIYNESSQERTDFLKYRNCTYDNCFSYRYLIRLRDYAQHGHLPINFNQKGFCFDLHQLLTKPHFTVNAALKKELESIRLEVMSHYGDIATFSIHRTVAEFTKELLAIYLEFIKTVKPKFQLSEMQFSEISERYSYNHTKVGSLQLPCFLYRNSNSEIHAIVTESRLELDSYTSVVNSTYLSYKKLFENIEQNSIKLWLRLDESRIEIEFGDLGELESHPAS